MTVLDLESVKVVSPSMLTPMKEFSLFKIETLLQTFKNYIPLFYCFKNIDKLGTDFDNYSALHLLLIVCTACPAT